MERGTTVGSPARWQAGCYREGNIARWQLSPSVIVLPIRREAPPPARHVPIGTLDLRNLANAPGISASLGHSLFDVPSCSMPLILAALICLTLLPSAYAQTPVPPDARLAWDIVAANQQEAHSNKYTLYVDDVGTPLASVDCVAVAEAGTFECSAMLPWLPPGTHVLEVSSKKRVGNALRESSRSPAFHVLVPGFTAVTQRHHPGATETSSGVSAHGAGDVELIATGFHLPVDIAAIADDVLLIAERGGTVRMLSDRQLHSAPVLTLPDVVGSSSAALLSLAADSEFASNGFIYTVSATESSTSGLVYRLERFHYARGTFSQRILLLDGIRADVNHLAAVVRVAVDGSVLVAFGDNGAHGGRTASSYNGKVLRVTRDGTTPREHPAASPIIASGFSAPLGLAWGSDPDTLWVLDGGVLPRLVAITGLSGRAAAANLPLSTTLAASLVRAGTSPLSTRDEIVLPAVDGLHTIALKPPAPGHEKLLTKSHGPFTQLPSPRVVTVASSGDIYVATTDRLFRLVKP